MSGTLARQTSLKDTGNKQHLAHDKSCSHCHRGYLDSSISVNSERRSIVRNTGEDPGLWQSKGGNKNISRSSSSEPVAKHHGDWLSWCGGEIVRDDREALRRKTWGGIETRVGLKENRWLWKSRSVVFGSSSDHISRVFSLCVPFSCMFMFVWM